MNSENEKLTSRRGGGVLFCFFKRRCQPSCPFCSSAAFKRLLFQFTVTTTMSARLYPGWGSGRGTFEAVFKLSTYKAEGERRDGSRRRRWPCSTAQKRS